MEARTGSRQGNCRTRIIEASTAAKQRQLAPKVVWMSDGGKGFWQAYLWVLVWWKLLVSTCLGLITYYLGTNSLLGKDFSLSFLPCMKPNLNCSSHQFIP
jgi:hypothetical protein